MDELAFGIEPNFAANITPSLAEKWKHCKSPLLNNQKKNCYETA
jgi:hypothetical protein